MELGFSVEIRSKEIFLFAESWRLAVLSIEAQVENINLLKAQRKFNERFIKV